MGSRELIILSLLFVSSTVFGAKTATDYANQGSQYYIFGQDDSAKAEFETGLSKFPNDPELQALAGLIKKKPPEKQDQQNQQQQNQQQQQKDQDQQQQKEQQQQGQSQNQSGSGKDQQQQKKNEQSQGKNQQQKSAQPTPGESPSPSPSPNQEKQRSEAGESSPTPGPGSTPPATAGQGQSGNEQPSPSPGEGETGEPSATPAETPQKKFAGEVKGAGEDKSQKPPDKDAQLAEAELEKEGQMSERQAEALLESMKEEEARVQLNEHKATRRVYNDW